MPYARAGRAVCAGILLGLLACSSEPGRTALHADSLRIDDTGRAFAGPVPAGRILSLVPAATEILFALGAGPRVVARTDFCDHPPAARALPSVGNGIRPAVEPILAFRPDLIVLFAGPDNAATTDRLRQLAAPVFAVRHNTVEDLIRNIRRLGALTGRAEAADSLVRALHAGLDSVARAAAGPPVRVYYDLWGDPPHTIGRGSYLNALIRIGGGRNVFEDLEAPSPQINVEAVLAADPDVILVPGGRSGTDPAEALRKRPGWRAIPAVREGRVGAVNPDLVHRLGPRLPEAARALADAIKSAQGRGQQ